MDESREGGVTPVPPGMESSLPHDTNLADCGLPHIVGPPHRSRYWAGGLYADAPLHAVNAGLSNVGCAVVGLLGAAFVLALAAQIACWVMQFRFP